MQSAQRTLCRQAAPSSCTPPPGDGPGAALERRRAAEWPLLPFCPVPSSDSVQTPAAGTYQLHRNDRPARPYGGSRCLVKIKKWMVVKGSVKSDWYFSVKIFSVRLRNLHIHATLRFNGTSGIHHGILVWSCAQNWWNNKRWGRNHYSTLRKVLVGTSDANVRLTFEFKSKLIGVVEGEHLLMWSLLICVEHQLSGEHKHWKASLH